MTELNDHDVGAGFDKSICTGEHPDVDGECPKLNGDADGLVQIVQKAVSSTGADTCGACGCPLATMDMMDAPPVPSLCPRYNLHTNAGESTW